MNTQNQPVVVAVFGTGKAEPGDAVFETAMELGRLLAENGFTPANGGYGGTMLATAKGAQTAGGEVIGVTCKAFKRSKANQYISREIPAENLDCRLKNLIELGQAYVVLTGGTGTLLELACVWEQRNKGFSNGDKPIILMGEFWQPLVEMMSRADSDCGRFVQRVDSPKQAVELLRKHFHREK